MATTKGMSVDDLLKAQIKALRSAVNQLNYQMAHLDLSPEMYLMTRDLRDRNLNLLFKTVHMKKKTISGEAQVLEKVIFGSERIDKFDETLDDVHAIASTSRGILDRFTGVKSKDDILKFTGKTKDELHAWMAQKENDPDELSVKCAAATMASSPDTILTYMPQFVPRLLIAIRLFTQVTKWVDRMLIIANMLMDFKVMKALTSDILKAIQNIFMNAWIENYGVERLPRQNSTPNQDKEGRTTVEGEAQMEDVSKVVLAVAMMGGIFVYGKLPPESEINRSVKLISDKFANIGKIGSGVRGAFTIFDTVVKGVDLVVKACADHIAPHWHPLSQIQDHREDILAWMDKVSEVDSDHTRLLVTTNPDMRNDIFKLRDQGDVYFNWFNRMPKDQQLITGAFLKCHAAIIKLSNEVARAPLNMVAKTDPFCFCLYGEKGTGKSFLLPRLVNKICDEYGIAVFRRMYPREMAEKYWSDYSHQFAVVLDDFAQVVNPVLFDPYFEFIQLKSNVPKILPMAEISEKGRAFTSKLIAMTTNVPYPKPTNVADHGALWRRRDMLIRVKSKQVVNYEEVEIGQTSHLEFYIMNSTVAGANEAGPYTYDQIEGMLVRRCISFLNRQKQVVRYLNFSQLEHLKRLYLNDRDQATKHLIDDYMDAEKQEIVGESQSLEEHPRTVVTNFDKWERFREPNQRWIDNRAVTVEHVSDPFGYRVCKSHGYCNACIFEDWLENHESRRWAPAFQEKEYEFLCRWLKANAIKQNRNHKVSIHDRCAYRHDEYTDPIQYQKYIGNVQDPTTAVTRMLSRANQPKGVEYYDDDYNNCCLLGVDVASMHWDLPWWTLTEIMPHYITWQTVHHEWADILFDAKKELRMMIQSMFRNDLQRVKLGNEPRFVDWDLDCSMLYRRAVQEGESQVEDPVPECYGSCSSKQTHLYRDYKEQLLLQSLETKWDSVGKQYAEQPKAKIPSLHSFLVGAWSMYELEAEHTTCKPCLQRMIQELEKERASRVPREEIKEKIRKSFGDYLKEWWNKYDKWRKEHIYYDAILKFFVLWGLTRGVMYLANDGLGDEDLSEYELIVRQYKDKGVNLTREEAIDLLAETQNKEYHRGETRFRPMRKPVRGAPIHGEAHALHKEMDPNGSSVMKYRVFPKIYRATLVSAGQRLYSQNAYHLYGRVILANKHFLQMFKEGDYIELQSMQGIVFTVPFDEENLWKSESDDDLAAYFCDLHIPAGKDNRHQVITNDDLAYMERFPCTVCYQDADGTAYYYDGYARPMEHDVSLTKEKIMLRNGWYMDVVTAKGQCGGIMTSLNPRCARKIVGMHCASVCKGTVAVSQLLTQELLEPMYKFFSNKTINYVQPAPIPELKKGQAEMAEGPDLGNIEVLGILQDRVPDSKKHHIIPSLVHDEIFIHETEPSVLSRSDPRGEVDVDPLMLGVAKYGTISVPYPEKDVKRSIADLKRRILEMKPERKPRVLTVEEAINGIPLDHFDRLDMKTSPGYPYVKYRPPCESGKKYLFEFDEETDKYAIKDTLLQQRLALRIAKAKLGEKIECQMSAQLKSERRPIEKIKQMKTRVFIMSPVDKTIHDRMYFLDFCACLMKNRSRSFHSVGIDAGSSDWADLYWYLRELSDIGFDGDHENYDGKFMIQWFRGILEIVNEFYDDGPENALVRSVLIDEMIYNHVRVRNFLVMLMIGMPSGISTTAIFNSCGNELEIQTVWLGLAKENSKEQANSVEYHSNVRPTVFGDDNAMTVRPAVLPWFNAITYSEYLKRYNRVYTPAAKGTAHVKARQLLDLRFLKRGFRVVPGKAYRVYAPIERRSVNELLNWVTDTNDPVEQLTLNYIDAQRFMFHEGKVEYDKFCSKVNPVLRKHGIPIPPHDFYFFEDEFEATF